MRIATVDVSSIAAAVRRREALLRYARYLLLFNIGAAAWFVIVQFWHAASLRTWTALAPGPDWRWTALVLGAVAVTYLVLAHRLWWAYAPIVLVQVVYFFCDSITRQADLSRFGARSLRRRRSASDASPPSAGGGTRGDEHRVRLCDALLVSL